MSHESGESSKSAVHEKNELDQLQRYSFTLSNELIEKIDVFAQRLVMNRSMIIREAVSDWISQQTARNAVTGSGVSVLSFVYDHHDQRLLADIMHIQHDFEKTVSSSTHLHLSHSRCFEIVICRGEIELIKSFSERLRAIKGISLYHEVLAPDAQDSMAEQAHTEH